LALIAIFERPLVMVDSRSLTSPLTEVGRRPHH